MRPAFYNSLTYKQKQSVLTKETWQKGLHDSIVKPLETRNCKNPNCAKAFSVKPYDQKVYCSSRCSATINNGLRPKKLNYCMVCNRQTKRFSRKYCSVRCQSTHRHQEYVKNWQGGYKSGNVGIATSRISSHIKHFIIEKYGEKCTQCGWNQRHSITHRIPLEMDHIDGNANNNNEDNLRLLCPNCHSLTPHFRNLNRGHGRAWRQKQSNIV